MSATESLVCVEHKGRLFFVPGSLPDRRSRVVSPIHSDDGLTGPRSSLSASQSSLEPATPKSERETGAGVGVERLPMMMTAVTAVATLVVASAVLRPYLLALVAT